SHGGSHEGVRFGGGRRGGERRAPGPGASRSITSVGPGSSPATPPPAPSAFGAAGGVAVASVPGAASSPSSGPADRGASAAAPVPAAGSTGRGSAALVTLPGGSPRLTHAIASPAPVARLPATMA